jgi:hypothetical protein
MSAVTDLPPDMPPVVETGAEHVCASCGAPVQRRGTRGRWPSQCEACRAAASSASGPKQASSRRASTSRARAAEAAEVVLQIHGLVAAALVLPIPGNPVYLPATASALASASQGVFAEQLRAALEGDKALCDIILKVGVMQGRGALIMAYGMLVGALVPVAMAEIADRRAARETIDVEV